MAYNYKNPSLKFLYSKYLESPLIRNLQQHKRTTAYSAYQFDAVRQVIQAESNKPNRSLGRGTLWEQRRLLKVPQSEKHYERKRKHKSNAKSKVLWYLHRHQRQNIAVFSGNRIENQVLQKRQLWLRTLAENWVVDILLECGWFPPHLVGVFYHMHNSTLNEMKNESKSSAIFVANFLPEKNSREIIRTAR